jgi:hypothetical protein
MLVWLEPILVKIMNRNRSLNFIIGKSTVAVVQSWFKHEGMWLSLVPSRASCFKTLIAQCFTPTWSNVRVPAWMLLTAGIKKCED